MTTKMMSRVLVVLFFVSCFLEFEGRHAGKLLAFGAKRGVEAAPQLANWNEMVF